MKQIIATKVKDGWVVEIIERQIVKVESDVLTLIRQNGLHFIKGVSNETKIYAC